MKALVDNSVWIDHLRGVRTRETDIFDALLALLEPERETPASPTLIVGDLVLCEVLRGIPNQAPACCGHGGDARLRAGDDRWNRAGIGGGRPLSVLAPPGGHRRKTIDLLIGTWCITEGCGLLHSDRDFDPMAQHLGLCTL